MIKTNVKRLIYTALATFGLFGLVAMYSPVANAALFDNAKKEACAGASLSNSGSVNNSTGECVGGNSSKVDSTIKAIIDILSVIVGIVAVVVLIISGLRMIASGGDSAKVSAAKNGVLYAVIGLVIVALAQIIVKFVLNRVNN